MCDKFKRSTTEPLRFPYVTNTDVFFSSANILRICGTYRMQYLVLQVYKYRMKSSVMKIYMKKCVTYTKCNIQFCKYIMNASHTECILQICTYIEMCDTYRMQNSVVQVYINV